MRGAGRDRTRMIDNRIPRHGVASFQVRNGGHEWSSRALQVEGRIEHTPQAGVVVTLIDVTGGGGGASTIPTEQLRGSLLEAGWQDGDGGDTAVRELWRSKHVRRDPG